jgi:phage tail tape-measure protein
MKLQNLQGIQSSYLLPYYQQGQNLLQLMANTGMNDQQLAQQMYLSTLPYTATVTMPGNSGISGAISGATTGAQMGSAGGPIGTAIGALAGGTIGYFGSKSGPSNQSLYLYQLEQERKSRESGNNALMQLLSQSNTSPKSTSSVF